MRSGSGSHNRNKGLRLGTARMVLATGVEVLEIPAFHAGFSPGSAARYARAVTAVHDRLRASRGFDASEVAAAKVGRLVGWFHDQRLDAAIVGVSGGVDSALALALLVAASRCVDSPLRCVVALLLPIARPGAR